MVTMLPVSAARLKDHLRRSRNGARYMRLEALISCPSRTKAQSRINRRSQSEEGQAHKADTRIPRLHDINRASWSLSALATVYERLYGASISKSSISEYFQAAGYKFKKAKKVLTSSDPEYRRKLSKITQILSELTPNEKFFSIDEFGPFSVRSAEASLSCLAMKYGQYRKDRRAKVALYAPQRLSFPRIRSLTFIHPRRTHAK